MHRDFQHNTPKSARMFRNERYIHTDNSIVILFHSISRNIKWTRFAHVFLCVCVSVCVAPHPLVTRFCCAVFCHYLFIYCINIAYISCEHPIEQVGGLRIKEASRLHFKMIEEYKIMCNVLVASLMSLMASLVTTSRMQQCFNVLIDIHYEFLSLFHCCVLLEINLLLVVVLPALYRLPCQAFLDNTGKLIARNCKKNVHIIKIKHGITISCA